LWRGYVWKKTPYFCPGASIGLAVWGDKEVEKQKSKKQKERTEIQKT
jgi:hypothetical protein